MLRGYNSNTIMSDSTLVAYWLKPLQPIILGKKWAKFSKDKVWIIYLFLWNKFFQIMKAWVAMKSVRLFTAPTYCEFYRSLAIWLKTSILLFWYTFTHWKSLVRKTWILGAIYILLWCYCIDHEINKMKNNTPSCITSLTQNNNSHVLRQYCIKSFLSIVL